MISRLVQGQHDHECLQSEQNIRDKDFPKSIGIQNYAVDQGISEAGTEVKEDLRQRI